MTSPPPARKVAFVSTSNYALRHFLAPHIAQVARKDDVVLICNLEHGRPEVDQNIAVHSLPIARQPKPLQDLIVLVRLVRLMRRERFDEVYTISPKGGFLGALASWIARVPTRVHFFTGQVWATSSGTKRWIYRTIDRLIGRICTHGLVDSPSQLDFLVAETVISRDKARVLGSGSIRGVDTERFRPDAGTRQTMRQRLGIEADQIVFLFLGRLTVEKGVFELLEAFAEMSDGSARQMLVFAGPDEGCLAPLRALAAEIDEAERVVFLPATDRPQDLLAMADVFCLPSHREGFPMVVLEAASAGVPAVASDIYGTRDAVKDGETGCLHAPLDIGDLARKMTILSEDRDLRERYGASARKRCLEEFSEHHVLSAFAAFRAQVDHSSNA
jgi:glycosyltransferase involved in cell wall biosynthesis